MSLFSLSLRKKVKPTELIWWSFASWLFVWLLFLHGCHGHVGHIMLLLLFVEHAFPN